MMEARFLGGNFNGVSSSGDQFFGKIIDLVDFPMESLEGNSFNWEDWHAKLFEAQGLVLGLSSLEAFLGSRHNASSDHDENVGYVNGGSDFAPSPSPPTEKTELKKATPIEEASEDDPPDRSLEPVSSAPAYSCSSIRKGISESSERLIPVHAADNSQSYTIKPLSLLAPLVPSGSKRSHLVMLASESLSKYCNLLEPSTIPCKTRNTVRTKLKKTWKLSWQLDAAETKEDCSQGEAAEPGQAPSEPSTSSNSCGAPAGECSNYDENRTPQRREGPKRRPRTLAGTACGVLSPKHLPDGTEDSSWQPGPFKKCSHCESTRTPQWREGPLGLKTLCNACGVRYRKRRLFPEYRPAASPTFDPSLHSNLHKKVVEMRNRAGQKVAMAEPDHLIL